MELSPRGRDAFERDGEVSGTRGVSRQHEAGTRVKQENRARHASLQSCSEEMKR